MDAAGLKAQQAPLKNAYRETPDKALITLKARGSIDDQAIACKVETGRAIAIAGLHPATGGSGMELCSGDMLLEALVACAGVTLKAVATALEFQLDGAAVSAEGDLDFRGTLGVAKDAPVGFRAIRLSFDLKTNEPQEQDRFAAEAHRALLRGVPDDQPEAGAVGDDGPARRLEVTHHRRAAARPAPIAMTLRRFDHVGDADPLVGPVGEVEDAGAVGDAVVEMADAGRHASGRRCRAR